MAGTISAIDNNFRKGIRAMKTQKEQNHKTKQLFTQKVDTRSRAAMVSYLSGHFRYDTMNSWNRSTSYAHKVKVYNLELTAAERDAAFELLECEEVWDTINNMLSEFGRAHDWNYQAAFNGRSGGYIVLIQGGCKKGEHLSYCRACGQRNFTKVENNKPGKCGKCGKAERVNYENPPRQIYTQPGLSLDQGEDFSEFSMDDLKNRVDLVQSFDRLAQDIYEYFVFCCRAGFEKETITIKTKKEITVLKHED
jgi:hypothetical protein